MIDNKKILAVVPARAGSKRLPGKNLLDLAGKPLIAWSIEAGLGSRYVDRVIVSTESQDIAEVSIKFGAEVPFIRPAYLASDGVTVVDVSRHAVEKMHCSAERYNYLLVLQPTSPLRTAEMIDEALEQMTGRNARGIVSVCEVEHPIEWMNALPEDNSLDAFINPSILNKRSQDFPQRYLINGAIYAVEIPVFVEERQLLLRTGAIAYIMNRLASVDIDTADDLNLVRCLYRSMDRRLKEGEIDV